MPFALITTVPFGALAAVTVSGSPSGSLSLASTLTVTGISSLVEAVSLVAVGAGLVIVQLIVVETLPPLPSEAVTVAV